MNSYSPAWIRFCLRLDINSRWSSNYIFFLASGNWFCYTALVDLIASTRTPCGTIAISSLNGIVVAELDKKLVILLFLKFYELCLVYAVLFFELAIYI